ncbi:MAG: DUF2934 domain-containing protein [Actinobacteria bacterium]|nr:DUF2934 domain-containing protein [Actinomycetota bacterium]
MAAKKETTTKKAPSIRKPAVRRTRKTAVTEESIATRAYFLHLEGGDDPVQNWLRAERELVGAA